MGRSRKNQYAPVALITAARTSATIQPRAPDGERLGASRSNFRLSSVVWSNDTGAPPSETRDSSYATGKLPSRVVNYEAGGNLLRTMPLLRLHLGPIDLPNPVALSRPRAAELRPRRVRFTH